MLSLIRVKRAPYCPPRARSCGACCRCGSLRRAAAVMVPSHCQTLDLLFWHLALGGKGLKGARQQNNRAAGRGGGARRHPGGPLPGCGSVCGSGCHLRQLIGVTPTGRRPGRPGQSVHVPRAGYAADRSGTLRATAPARAEAVGPHWGRKGPGGEGTIPGFNGWGSETSATEAAARS